MLYAWHEIRLAYHHIHDNETRIVLIIFDRGAVEADQKYDQVSKSDVNVVICDTHSRDLNENWSSRLS